jgi:integrase/recombinase XerD
VVETSAIQVAAERYLRHLAIERGLASNTLEAYGRDLATYNEFLASRAITEPAGVETSDVSAFIEFVGGREEGPLASSSIARMLSSVRGLHSFLHDEGIVTRDVAAEVKPPKLGTRLPKAISVSDMGRMLAATDGDDAQSMRNKALLELLYATGARVSEAVALNVDDVLDDGTGSAETVRLLGKGNKQRIVPVGSYARDALDRYLVRARPLFAVRGLATPALFLGARGQRVSRQNAWLIIRAAADRAQLGYEVSPHTFRHSFATHLLEGGADVRVVQELLGHSSVATTQIYTLVTADSLRDMYSTAHPRAR